MGYFNRKPTNNDPPARPGEKKSPWLRENEFVDEVCLLLNGLVRH